MHEMTKFILKNGGIFMEDRGERDKSRERLIARAGRETYDEIRKDLAMDIIDMLLDKSDEYCFAWSYGDETMFVSDAINIVNNIAGTSYKRCGGGKMDYRQRIPDTVCRECHICSRYFCRFPKTEHRNHCQGSDRPCGDFKSVFDCKEDG